MNTQSVSLAAVFELAHRDELRHVASMCGFSGQSVAGLAPFQALAAYWITNTVRRFGGALLCDEVGLGKTRTALVAAKLYGGRVEVIAPAHLCTMWRDALRAFGVEGHVLSDGLLSLGEAPPCNADIVLVDEAHRYGNGQTRRSLVLAERVWGRAVVLISATPARNRREELAQLLAVFVSDATITRLSGLRPGAWSEAEECAVASLLSFVAIGRSVSVAQAFDRRAWRAAGDTTALPAMPARSGASLPGIAYSEALLAELVEVAQRLVPLRGEPGALYRMGVLRALSSSPQAAAATLLRGCAFARRWCEARDTGGTLSRAEFRQLFEGGAEQTVFGFWYRSEEEANGFRVEAVDRAETLARALQSYAPVSPEVRRWVLGVEGGAVLFAERRETVEAVARYFASERPVISVTGDRAWIRGIGRVSMAHGLEDFRRRCVQGTGPLLVCSSVVSEGVNLQTCGALVHLDLAWNPTRMVQREGRVVRPGGAAEVLIGRVIPCVALERRVRSLATIREKEQELVFLSADERDNTPETLLQLAWSRGVHRRRPRGFAVLAARGVTRGLLVLFRGGGWRWLGGALPVGEIARVVRSGWRRRRSGAWLRLSLCLWLGRRAARPPLGTSERAALAMVRAGAMRLGRSGRAPEAGELLRRAVERLHSPLPRGGMLLRAAHCGAVPLGAGATGAEVARWVEAIPVQEGVRHPRPIAVWIVRET